MLNNLLGTKFKLVTGYRGGSPIRLAIERGELDGWAGLWLGWKARKPGWVRDKKLNHLLQVARKRAPDLPNTPTLLEFAKTEEQKKIFGFVSSTGIISRALSAPPGVPAARLAAIEKAYAATLHDPEFLKEAAKRRYPIQPTTAKEVQAAVRQVISLSPDLVKKVKAAMGFK
jgi:tripartite-type tricarboxylate transporter receptor subunit TctC